MPRFIRTNSITTVNRHGHESDRQVLFTDNEIIERVKLNPSLVIEVNESHAQQVMRVQGKYQEITDEVFSKCVAARQEARKPARKGKVNDSNKSSLKFVPADDDE